LNRLEAKMAKRLAAAPEKTFMPLAKIVVVKDSLKPV
jgi:hypothetical protein